MSFENCLIPTYWNDTKPKTVNGAIALEKSSTRHSAHEQAGTLHLAFECGFSSLEFTMAIKCVTNGSNSSTHRY